MRYTTAVSKWSPCIKEEEEEEGNYICIVCKANDKGFIFVVQGIHLNICEDCWCNVSDLECPNIQDAKNDGIVDWYEKYKVA